ncbi:MAG: NAD(P)H-quinone oxidoreductase [Gemmatimonadales bacterium]|jgi:putative PIG3 family NAD(P)H quinone oxidoreductase
MPEMRAVVVTSPGGPDVLELRQRPIRDPARGEIRVRVHAAGVNRADLLQRRGLYPPPPGWPADILGLEYAGTVEAIGEAVELWREGDRVMGIVGGGGYADYVVVSEREAIRVPDRLSFEAAAAVPEVFITAHDALYTQLQIGPGETVLIHAVGSGVGTAALQLVKVTGGSVIGTSRTGWKLERARELGLDVAIDSWQQDVAAEVRAATHGSGVDAVLDLVGAPLLAANLECLAVKGRLIVVGVSGGRSAELDLGLVLRKRLRIVGTSLRMRPLEEKIAAARRFEAEIVPLIASGRVEPIVDSVFPIDDVVAGHQRMEANANFGKIVLTLSPS